MAMTSKTSAPARWSPVLPIVGALLASCGGGGGGGGEGGTNASPPPPPAQTANVSISAAGPVDAVPSGLSTHIVVTVSNAGPAAASALLVTPHLGSQLSQTNSSCVATGAAVCPRLDRQTYSVDSLPPGSSLTFDLEVLLFPGLSGAQSSTFTASASNNAVPGDVTAVGTVNAYSADVGVTTSASTAAVAAGGAITYTVTVVNSGPDTARNVVVNDWPDLGQLVGQVTCVANRGAVCPAAPAAFMTIPVLPVGASLQFVVSSTVPPSTGGPIVNRARVSAAGDPNPFNDSDAVAANAIYVPPPTSNAVVLQSDPGDYIGLGESHVYTQTDAILTVNAAGNHLRVTIAGEQQWDADFALPSALSQLQPGTYANLTRYGFDDPAVGGLDWHGEGRGCNQIGGTIVVNSASYVAGQLSALDMSFEQHCENIVAALRGQIRWSQSDNSAPPGPLATAPAGLWSPAADALPASGSYVYLQSDPTDFVGQGGYFLTTKTYAYTKANAVIAVTMANGVLTVKTDGNEHWIGQFQAMNNLESPSAGYYGGVLRYPFHNPAKGGMDWGGEGRGCNEENGWFAIDDITFANGNVSTLDLRFEQHCEKSAAALRGKIHWASSDVTVPAGPVQPPPAGLWSPPAGATPAMGNYVYLASDPGDFIGMGSTTTFTPANSTIALQTGGALFSISIGGQNISQQGYFQGMNVLAQLQPGYYPNLQDYPFHNPTAGGLDWSGDGRGCGSANGWFVIDRIVYTNGIITSIDLRFEQHCGPSFPALRGKIHWG